MQARTRQLGWYQTSTAPKETAGAEGRAGASVGIGSESRTAALIGPARPAAGDGIDEAAAELGTGVAVDARQVGGEL